MRMRPFTACATAPFIAQNTNDPQAALDYALQAQERLHESGAAKPDLEAQLLADIARRDITWTATTTRPNATTSKRWTR